jgi:outer membrane protein assembly factor BamB
LSGSDFVNVVLDGANLLAGTKGEIYCLDTTTGPVRWHNQLNGLGYGFVAIAGASQQVVAAAEKQKRDAAAAAVAAGAGA